MVQDNINLSNDALSKITIFSKYAKYIPEKKRRETWEEISDRVKDMHIKKYPFLEDELERAFQYVKDKKVVPSMRSMQFGGKPIELNNARIFNCSFTAIQTWKDFSEIIMLLLSGCGVGISVQRHHIENLPPIIKPTKTKKYLIGDSIEGWADSIRALFKAYMAGSYLPLYDYSDIRVKGTSLITSGGKAPGPEPLERCLNKLKSILDKKEDNTKLTSIEVHDIICHLADTVLSGGIRRAALISFFDKDDEDMLKCKGNFKVDILNGGFHYNEKTKAWEGEVLYKNKAQWVSLPQKQFNLFLESKTLPWYWFEPQRARANNSVVLLREETTKEEFENLWEIVRNSGAGEPGFYWTNSKEVLSNPCVVGDTLVLTTKGWVKIKDLDLIPYCRIITQDRNGTLYNSELKWVGITNKDDNIFKVSYTDSYNGVNSLYNILCNNKHKLYNSSFQEVSVVDLKKGEEIQLCSRSGIFEGIREMEYKEDVYDLTAVPNFNFFSRQDINSKLVSEQIIVNEDVFLDYFEIVNTKDGQKFAFELEIDDEILDEQI